MGLLSGLINVFPLEEGVKVTENAVGDDEIGNNVCEGICSVCLLCLVGGSRWSSKGSFCGVVLCNSRVPVNSL